MKSDCDVGVARVQLPGTQLDHLLEPLGLLVRRVVDVFEPVAERARDPERRAQREQQGGRADLERGHMWVREVRRRRPDDRGQGDEEQDQQLVLDGEGLTGRGAAPAQHSATLCGSNLLFLVAYVKSHFTFARMDETLRALVWRGLLDANPWWRTGEVPKQRTASYRRRAFRQIYEALSAADLGRGVVVLGPRRVGKTVLVHQVIEELLARGRAPTEVCFVALDDVALRDRDLGELLTLIEGRLDPAPNGRVLILDEVQHAKEWSGWLKRIADRRDPYTFLATGSSATALRRGGHDAGLGRWRELTLFPWSFREHVELRGLDKQWSFAIHERLFESDEDVAAITHELGDMPPDEAERLESALIDYLLRGGFPEAAVADDLAESRRRLRQDILDRALGRDVLDVMSVDARTLERMFLRICMHPGGLWNEAEVARELGITRPTVSKYLSILEHAFLVFRLPNLASPIKGQPKVYLVAPALRQALLALDAEDVRRPSEWGLLAENTVVAMAMSNRHAGSHIGFWRKGSVECDAVILNSTRHNEYIEVKRGGKHALAGIQAAASALGKAGVGSGRVLVREPGYKTLLSGGSDSLHWVLRMPLSVWLYAQKSDALSDLRLG